MTKKNNFINKSKLLHKDIVDGYDSLTNTIYEFNGDYWYGHTDKYKKDDINTSCKKPFGELYEKTLQKESNFIKNNYNYND